MDILIIILLVFNVALTIVSFLKKSSEKNEIEKLKNEYEHQLKTLKEEINEGTQNAVKNLAENLYLNLKNNNDFQMDKMNLINTNLTEKQEVLLKSVSSQFNSQEQRFQTFSVENEQKLENIRGTIEKRLVYIQEDNNKKLDEMRMIVDEKLQKTLEDKMNKSFQIVSERLEQVYKGLGEMQSLATGVGDLKKVLTNVKSRGILGEIQLGAILEEILTKEQYEVNVATKKGSRDVVEYAVKIPNDNGNTLYLPIDSKFPGDTYSKLCDAYEIGNKEEINACVKQLITTIKKEAKDIHTKYIDPPNTTEFAIMFLPFEGLYAEVVNRGMVEVLQREFQVNIAGPSTMAALLNSLQMGFKTFAIEKRSGEVWSVLKAVKTEFDRFAGVLELTQKKFETAHKELEKLVGTRTRQIQKKLVDIESLSGFEAAKILEIEDFSQDNDLD